MCKAGPFPPDASLCPCCHRGIFDADGALIQPRREITPRHFERMIWGQDDGSGVGS